MEFVARTRLAAFAPNADVLVDEEQQAIRVVIEVAGAEAESLQFGFDGRSLVIAGRRRKPRQIRQGSFLQKEIAYGDFVKRIRLPVSINCNEVSATYEEGLLTIVAPIEPGAYLTTQKSELHLVITRTHS
ncbi:MAG: Hsp20/alpha crystallin family protein [Candidatus Eremiobacteraeota bacterium]|nr:Hsp20/alpha crystallin family protein [Candidatus Eremiobacteraeota bacterium]MBV9057252.1 Hsp20/alpha crystallin family protein [Candidatus Eremiobacteraeota bacterium]MBV9700471.1 Hsp20/alpha crystallin family protein [Candidatus Eremiobacteraeota bacterium]